MRMNKNVRKILAVGGAIAIAGGALIGCTQPQPEVGLTKSEYDDELNKAYIRGKVSVDIKSDNAKIDNDAYLRGRASVTQVDVTSNDAEVEAPLKEEITRLQGVIDDTTTIAQRIEAGDIDGYNLDELEIGAEVNFTVSDRQLSGLFDDEVVFDGDDYDAEEAVYLTGLVVAHNYEDEYLANTYLQIPDYGVKIVMEFEPALNTILITPNETLEFDFLGERVEVSEWNFDEVTFTKGTEYTLGEDSSVEVDGKTVTLNFIGDGYVSVTVGSESEKIYEDDTERVNDIEIKVTDVIESTSWRKGIATLEIGQDVLFEVQNGDEYEPNDIWEWAIDANSIGLVLTESYLSVQDDEEFRALGVGERFALPNNYVFITYDGLVEEDTEKYTFELDSGFVEADGDFVDGINGYDTIYIDTNGIIYDGKNNKKELIDLSSITLGDTGLSLTTDNEYINIINVGDDIKLALNLTELKVGAETLCIGDSGDEEDYLTNYGIVISKPEDGCEDEEFTVVVPEEELEASLTISYKE